MLSGSWGNVTSRSDMIIAHHFVSKPSLITKTLADSLSYPHTLKKQASHCPQWTKTAWHIKMLVPRYPKIVLVLAHWTIVSAWSPRSPRSEITEYRHESRPYRGSGAVCFDTKSAESLSNLATLSTLFSMRLESLCVRFEVLWYCSRFWKVWMRCQRFIEMCLLDFDFRLRSWNELLVCFDLARSTDLGLINGKKRVILLWLMFRSSRDELQGPRVLKKCFPSAHWKRKEYSCVCGLSMLCH